VYRKLDGQLSVGIDVLDMRTENVQVLFRPALSIALQLTTVVPMEKLAGFATVGSGVHAFDAMPLPSDAARAGV